MRFGIGLPGANPMSNSRWDTPTVVKAMIEVAKKADDLGFDFVGAQDHPVIPKASTKMIGPRWFDAVSTLGFLAGATKRIRLLTSVVVVPYRNPFTMANSIATLDRLSKGRVIFGVGIGHLRSEFDTLGVPYEERAARTDEYLKIMRGLWTEEALTFDGQFFSCRDMMLEPKPVQQPLPIWVGGNGKPAIRRAAALGQAWHPFQVTRDDLPGLVQHAQELAAKAGRGPLDISVSMKPIARDPQAIRQRSAEEVQRRVEQIAGASDYYRKIAAKNLDSSAITETDDVHAEIEGLKDAGATCLQVGFRYRELPELLDSMEWFAQEIMPGHRDAAS